MRLVLAFGLLLSGCWNSPQVPPIPHRWLTDTVNLLSPEVQSRLDSQLEAYEKRTRHQVFVWIGKSTFGEPHQDWAFRTFNAWGIGRQRYDDGVVLFVFVKDDMRWITVGYGLEAAISDREAVRICREIIAPKMRAGQAAEGISRGIDVILSDIDGWEHPR